MTPMPPNPSQPLASPGQGAPPPAGLSGLLAGSNATPIGPTPDEKVQAYMEQVRNIHLQIDALAQQHPEAASELNDAKNALTQSMSKVATAVSSPEQQAQPQTF